MKGKIEATEPCEVCTLPRDGRYWATARPATDGATFLRSPGGPRELCSLSIQNASHSITRAACLQQTAACVSQGWRRSTYPLPTVRNVSGLALITTRVRGLLKLEDVCSGYRLGIWECPFPRSLNLTVGTEDLAGTLELLLLVRSI